MPGQNVANGYTIVALGGDDAENKFIVSSSSETRWDVKDYFTLYISISLAISCHDFWEKIAILK